MKHLITSTLLLLALLLPATVNAYDFEVDGIYYNKTSANTVEVTYKDINSDSYNDTVIIPSIVTYNSKSYSVTAIGDSAFYNNYVRNVTIPETVTSIGRAAFVNLYDYNHMYQQLTITCLASTPPTMEGAFDKHEHKFPFWFFYPYLDNRDPSYQVLFVSSASYQNYKDENETLGYFNWIFCYDGEKTAAPSYTIDYERSFDHCTAIHVTFSSNEDSEIYNFRAYSWVENYVHYWSGGGFVSIYSQSECQKTYIDGISGFAIAEGKLPSDLVSVPCYDYLRSPYVMYESYSDDSFFDSGIYYTVSGNAASVSGGFHRDPCNYSSFWIRGVDYSGDIIIPNTVNGYPVHSIGYMAFANCDLEYLEFPSTIYIGMSALDGTRIKKLYYQLKDNCQGIFYGCSAETVYLSGNGSWAGLFPNGVKELYIGSGVTGFYEDPDIDMEISINPDIIYSYASTPPRCNEYSFTGYDAELHVPATSLAAYFTAPYWCNFTNIIGDVNELTNLSLDKDSIEVLIGSQTTLNGIMTPANATPNTINWITSDNHVATVENGVVTALNKGECDIIAICQEKRAICHLFVSSALTTGLTLSQDSAKMEVGDHLNLIATVQPDEDPDKIIRWSSTDGSVATVSNGTITALKCGECDIIASCCGKKAMCHIIVTDVLPIAINLSDEYAEIEVGNQLTLTAIVQPDNVTDNTIIWQSSNNEVANVDNYGVVTALGIGDCDIIASCGGIQATCHIKVIHKQIYITLDEHQTRVLPNHIVTLTPTVGPVPTDLVVTSSNPAVAAARLAGDKIQVVGITEGNATIYVNSADGYAFSDSCLVEVYTERGDVNCDGFVNISDGTVLIDILLGGDVNHSEDNADCNNDGEITISDLTALIDALLGGAPLPEKNYEVINVNGVSFKMIKVQGGTFTMGATPEQGTEEPWNDEWPTHEVTVSSFSIGQTEVTQELWQAVMGSNPSYFTGDPKRPVETVSWDECQQFIATLNQLTGMNFRMPTEAEWEFAARGGNRSEGYKYAGSNDINETAWWDDNAGDGVGESSPDYGTHPVALKKANELGLYDMSGNVWEWCQDWYGPYSQEAQINPTGPETGTEHLYRGGSWLNYARNCRVSCRFHWVTNGVNYVGLRLVK